jgi:small-conductance mechanosensitive channel/CRP-like cAMP-binding protein
MEQPVVRRLWRPFAILLLSAGFTFWNRELLLQFGSEALSQSQKVIAYAIQVGIWLSAAHFLNRLAIVFVWDGFITRTLGAPVPKLIKNIFTMVVYAVAVTGIIGIVFEQPISGFWATSGVVSIVVGIALRDVILDIFTGLAINVDRPYKIGDWIKVHGSSSDRDVTGRVLEIKWRTTRLETEDDSLVIMPNSLLGTMVVTNYWGTGPYSRFDTSFCLDFSIPPERACRVLTAGALAVVGQLNILQTPEPRVVIKNTTALGIEYCVFYWMSGWGDGVTQAAARSLINNSIMQHLKQAGITPAYPKQDLYYATMPVRQLDAKTLDDRTELLAHTELFQYLETAELRELAAKMRHVHFKQGEKVIKQGETGDSMFILAEGLLHVFLSGNGNGAEVRVGQLVPGEFFGEMSLLTGEPRGATILAMTDVVAHEITKESMTDLLSKRPQVADLISRVVAERRIRNSEKMATATAEERHEKTESLARQIVTKMRSFFKGVYEKSESDSGNGQQPPASRRKSQKFSQATPTTGPADKEVVAPLL